MVFIGAIDKNSRAAAQQILSAIPPSNIYVGCSGNFTFDQMASRLGHSVYSNDVSLYSRLIAAALMKEDFPIQCVNDELAAVFQGWQNTPYTSLIQVIFSIKIGEFSAKKNDYQCMMWDNYIMQNQQYFEELLEWFMRNPLNFKIASFHFGDFKEHLQNAPEDATLLLYAPTYKAGYEKLYKFVEQSFEYERPNYEIFDSKLAGAYYAELLQTKRACIYGDILYPEASDYLIGMAGAVNKKTVYCFASIPDVQHMYMQPATKLLSKIPVILRPHDQFSDNTEITVNVIPKNVVSHYKHLFMSSKVKYSLVGDFALGFFADRKLFGFAMFSKVMRTANEWDMSLFLCVGTERQFQLFLFRDLTYTISLLSSLCFL
ncbi:MAG: hypothetical protein FWG73_06905 [Planctomycetaceae bacterium]|nr:hypothetical protein [Planctomycetaceae bacterium]